MTKMINPRLLKNPLSVLLCVIICALALPFGASALGGNNTVTVKSNQSFFEPFTQTAAKGESFDVVIRLRSDLKIVDGTVVLGFDSSKLRVTACSGYNGVSAVSNLTEEHQLAENSVITTFTAGDRFFDFSAETNLLTYTFEAVDDIVSQEITVDFVNLIANDTYINEKDIEDISVNGDVKLVSHSQIKAESFSVGAKFAALKGDVDLSGKVNINDATELQLALVDKKTLNGRQRTVAQVFYDGKINIRDVTMIQLFLADIIEYL